MTRISENVFPNYMKMKSPDYTGEAWMLIRDIALGIVPYRSSKGADFKVQLNQPDAEIEKRLCKLLKIHHEEFNLTDAYITFVHDITPHLAEYGEIYFEVFGAEHTEELDIIPLSPLIHIGKKYYQFVPLQDWQDNARKINSVTNKNIWHLKLPRQLGTPKSHRKLLDKVQRLSEPTPKFFFQDGMLGKSVDYDFMYHRKLKEVAREGLTRRWGSIPSLQQLPGTTEYYYIIHSLRFKYAQALIREHITSEINLLIGRLGVENSIKVTGLPSSRAIQQSIKELELGSIGFADALNSARVP